MNSAEPDIESAYQALKCLGQRYDKRCSNCWPALIMLIYRDDYYTKEMSKDPGVTEIIIGKHRNGPTGDVRLAFLKEYCRFENLARRGSY